MQRGFSLDFQGFGWGYQNPAWSVSAKGFLLKVHLPVAN